MSLRSVVLPVLVVLGIVAVVVTSRWLAAGVVPIFDEAFVTLRYAANMAAGDGLVYNPGADWGPVLATASPGQAVLLAALAPAGVDLERFALVVNLCADVVTAALLVALLAPRPTTAAFALLGFALSPELVSASMGGGGGPLAAALGVSALLAARRERHDVAGFLVVLAALFRPEAALLVVGLAWNARRSPRALTRLVVPASLCAALALVALRLVYGSPVPAPIAASLSGVRPLPDALRGILAGLLVPRIAYVVLLPLVVVGAGHLLRDRDPTAPLIVGVGLTLAIWLLVGPELSPDAYVLAHLGLAVAFARGVDALIGQRLARLGPPVLALAAVGIAALGLFGLRAALPREGPALREHIWEPMASWAEESGLRQRDRTLLATEAGAIGWFAGGRVVDEAGLMWPGRHHGSVVESILFLTPEYLLLRTRRSELEALRGRDRLSRAYYPIRRFSLAGQTDLEPELAELGDEKVADYLLFRRRQ